MTNIGLESYREQFGHIEHVGADTFTVTPQEHYRPLYGVCLAMQPEASKGPTRELQSTTDDPLDRLEEEYAASNVTLIVDHAVPFQNEAAASFLKATLETGSATMSRDDLVWAAEWFNRLQLHLAGDTSPTAELARALAQMTAVAFLEAAV